MMPFTHAVCENLHCAVQYFNRPFYLTKIAENGTISHEAPCHVWMIPESLLSYLDNMFQKRSSLKKSACLSEHISKMSIDVDDVRMVVIVVLQQQGVRLLKLLFSNMKFT